MLLPLLITVTLIGPAQTVLQHGPDSPVSFYQNLMYFPHSVTSAYDRDALTLASPYVIGPGASYDACGAWLLSEFAAGGIVRGFYHAETDCDYSIPASLKSLGYAESYDGGLTFTSKGQITSTGAGVQAVTDQSTGTGDGAVVRNDNYYYLYMLDTQDKRVHLARSLISDGGRPGTWHKWDDGAFGQPGLGGGSDPIAEPGELLQRNVSHNSRLGLWIGLHRRADGWGLSVSEDGIRWQPVDRTIIESGFNWFERENDPTYLRAYFSIIGLDYSNDRSGGLFWLYYTEMPPFQGFEARSLRRQLVGVGDVAGAWLPVAGK